MGRLALHPFEVVAWGGLAAAVLFLRARGLRIDWNTVRYTIPPLIPVTLRAFAAGVLLQLGYRLAAQGAVVLRRRAAREAGGAAAADESPAVHPEVRAYLRGLFTGRWLVLSLRLWAVCLVFTYAYFWLKVSVPLVNPRLWDRALWDLDIALHLGYSPSIFVARLLQGTGMLPLLDLWYGWWLATVTYGIAFFFADPEAGERRRFMLSCVLLWTLGPWLYLSVPAVGPAYAFAGEWAEVAEEMPRAVAGQRVLRENYEKVVAGRSGPLTAFNPTRGVAAMPSLHVGAHWLLLLWVRRRARPLLVPAAVGTSLTFLGSLATGWHYAVDGYAGILLAQLCYGLATRRGHGRRWSRARRPANPARASTDGGAESRRGRRRGADRRATARILRCAALGHRPPRRLQ